MLQNHTSNSTKTITITLVRFCFPLILSGILQQLYNWADAFIVGNAEGDIALAAIGATSTAINFYVNLITGFSLGLSILFAQKYGAKEFDAISKLLSTFILLLGSLFLVLSIIGWCCAEPFLHLLNTPPDTLKNAYEYLCIIFIGFPFLTVYNIFSAALRGIGDSKVPFYSVLVSSIVNIVLDILFVFRLHMGVKGAAIATVVSQIAMTLFLIIYGLKKHKILHFNPKNKLFDRKSFTEGCRFGFPPMLQSSISSAGNIILQKFMNGFGTATVTAITTAYKIDSIVMVPIINFGSGISTLVAQNHGSSEYKKAYRIFKIGTIIMMIISVLLTATVIPTGGRIIGLFGASIEAIDIGNDFFLRIACCYLIYGIATSLRSYLEGIGDVMYCGIACVISLVARIIASYTLVNIFSNMVIAYAEAFSWVVLLILYYLRLSAKKKHYSL